MFVDDDTFSRSQYIPSYFEKININKTIITPIFSIFAKLCLVAMSRLLYRKKIVQSNYIWKITAIRGKNLYRFYVHIEECFGST